MSKVLSLGLGRLDRKLLNIYFFLFKLSSFTIDVEVFPDPMEVGFQSLRSSSTLVALLEVLEILELNGNFLMIFFFVYTSGLIAYYVPVL